MPTVFIPWLRDIMTRLDMTHDPTVDATRIRAVRCQAMRHSERGSAWVFISVSPGASDPA